MARAPGQRDEAQKQRQRWYQGLLAVVVAAGVAASLSISYTLYRTAQREWIVHAESDAQRLSSMLLDWMDESYAPLSGLAALVENSPNTVPKEFLNAFDGIESRATTVLLGAAAMLERDAQGTWVLVISSGNFVFLERDAADGFARLRPLIALAVARPNQFVLGPPVSEGNERLVSPVLVALTRVKTPTVLVGKLEYATLEGALRGAPTPVGFTLTLNGKFMAQPEIRPIIQARPGEKFVRRLITRATTGGADLEIVWGVKKRYGDGPDYAVAAVTLVGGLAVTMLFGFAMAGLIKRNRVINEKVDEATMALQRNGAELARAHELVRRAFGRYVSEEVAESLLRAPEALDLGGEEREATILMSDLRGFTAMAARLTPHEAIEVLNLYLEAMMDVIGRYQGTIDEIVGDAILVIFGAPVACEDHAEKAVACGLAMQLAMTEVNRRLTAKGASELEMGIGVHTGRVIVGNIGSLRRTKYAAVGANVNLAGRIESFTTGGQLLVSEDTRAQVKAALRIDRQFRVEPKGASRSLLLYEIGGIGGPFDLTLPSRSKPLRSLAPPLPVRFTVLEEKFVGRTEHEGRLTAVTELEASIQSALGLAVLSNLRVTVAATSHGNPTGEIYGKVVESVAEAPGDIRIRFTSITPELKAWAAALG